MNRTKKNLSHQAFYVIAIEINCLYCIYSKELLNMIPTLPSLHMYFSPDNGCLQYHTGITGRFETFNYPATSESHLPSQQLVATLLMALSKI